MTDTGQKTQPPHPAHPHAHEDATVYVPSFMPRWLVDLIDEEVRLKGTNRSAVLREVLAQSLDPDARKGGARYGLYLRARDQARARAFLASLTLTVLTLGGWTLGLLAAHPV